MTFERPDAWWLLALAAPIVALHLHHRKRRVVEVSSVELWRGLVAGGVGRGRFRSLRDSLALAFLLAALVAFAGAAAGPVTGDAASAPRRIAIVLDGSASMANPTLDESARMTRALRKAIEAESRLAPQDQLSVWLASGTPRVWVEPTTQRGSVDARWRRAVVRMNGMPPAEPIAMLAPACLTSTVRLALRAANGVADRPTTLLVLTDAVGAASLRDVDAGGVDLHVGAVDVEVAPKNSGIVACDVDPTDATRLLVHVATSDGPPAPRDAVLLRDPRGFEPKWPPVEVARQPLSFDADGNASATFPLDAFAKVGGLCQVRLDPPDDFISDDVAGLVLPATKPLAVAVVADKPSPFLVEALRAMPDVVDPARTTLVSPNAPNSAFDGVDVAIVEDALFYEGVPASLAFTSKGKTVEKPLLWGVGTHPILAGVDLSPLRIERAVVLDAVAGYGQQVIIASSAGPVGVATPADRHPRVEFGFRPEATTLPLEAAFPLLVRNALRWLAKPSNAPRYVVAGEPWPDGDGALVPYPAPGGPYTVRTPTGAETVVRWIPPKGFRLSPSTPTTAPSAADVVASLPDRSRDADTRRRHAPWLAAVGAALLAIGAALLPRARPAERPTVVAPPEDVLVASR